MGNAGLSLPGLVEKNLRRRLTRQETEMDEHALFASIDKGFTQAWQGPGRFYDNIDKQYVCAHLEYAG